MPVERHALDPRVDVLDFQPRAVPVLLDPSTTNRCPSWWTGPRPRGLDVGEPTFKPGTVDVTGPRPVVSTSSPREATSPSTRHGLVVDRDVELMPVDDLGEAAPAGRRRPATVHVPIPCSPTRQTQTLPVAPVVTGTPRRRVSGRAITVDPAAVTVKGDADPLVAARPWPTRGRRGRRTRDRHVSTAVALALPSGVVAAGTATVHVTIESRPRPARRTYGAASSRPAGQPGLDYALSTVSVLVTLGGPSPTSTGSTRRLTVTSTSPAWPGHPRAPSRSTPPGRADARGGRPPT